MILRHRLRATWTLSAFPSASLTFSSTDSAIRQKHKLYNFQRYTHIRQNHGYSSKEECGTSNLYTTLSSSSTQRPRFRLLELHPGHGIDPVKTHLHEVSLTEDLGYEAVSYCWGHPEDVKLITCNGQQLFVPRRLEVALRNIRHDDRPRMLWADAICINQSNVAEKESQVQLMRTIFSNAERTLIYLGDEEEKQAQNISKFAVWSIKLGLTVFRRRVNPLTSPRIPVWDIERGQYHILEPFSSHFYLELIGMLRMPWFQRAWVVQEVAVSSKATIFWEPRSTRGIMCYTP